MAAVLNELAVRYNGAPRLERAGDRRECVADLMRDEFPPIFHEFIK